MASSADEVRVVDAETGGEKGQKEARFGLIPPSALWELARVYGRGASKYADRNWEKGYNWSLSYDAACRHLNAFWMGEEIDPETGLHHLAHVAWHCFTLMQFAEHFREKDDRSELEVNGR